MSRISSLEVLRVVTPREALRSQLRLRNKVPRIGSRQQPGDGAAWFAARTPADQLDAAPKIQEQVFIDVPFVPLGE